MSGIRKPEFSREPAHKIQFASRFGEEVMWHACQVRATPAEEWPAINDKLPSSPCTQIARAEASPCSTSDKDCIILPFVLTMDVIDWLALLLKIPYKMSPLNIRGSGGGNIHKHVSYKSKHGD